MTFPGTLCPRAVAWEEGPVQERKDVSWPTWPRCHWVSFCTWVPEGGLGVIRDLSERRENWRAGLQRRERGSPRSGCQMGRQSRRWVGESCWVSEAQQSPARVQSGTTSTGEKADPSRAVALRRACCENQLWVTSTVDASSKVIAAWKASQCQGLWPLLGGRRRREKRWNRKWPCASTETGLLLNAVAPKPGPLAPPGTFENSGGIFWLVCGGRGGGSRLGVGRGQACYQTSTVRSTAPRKVLSSPNVNSAAGEKPWSHWPTHHH